MAPEQRPATRRSATSVKLAAFQTGSENGAQPPKPHAPGDHPARTRARDVATVTLWFPVVPSHRTRIWGLAPLADVRAVATFVAEVHILGPGSGCLVIGSEDGQLLLEGEGPPHRRSGWVDVIVGHVLILGASDQGCGVGHGHGFGISSLALEGGTATVGVSQRPGRKCTKLNIQIDPATPRRIPRGNTSRVVQIHLRSAVGIQFRGDSEVLDPETLDIAKSIEVRYVYSSS